MSRPRGVPATRLDHVKLRALALSQLNTGEENPTLSVPFTNYLVQTPALTAVITDEGVGHFMQEDEMVGVIYTLDGYSSQTVRLPIDDIRECATAEVVDLADAIRDFGDRLDDNHMLWYRKAQG